MNNVGFPAISTRGESPLSNVFTKLEEYMKAIRVITGILSVFVVMPIWYYLLYQILVRVNATELMFFLYWVYLPVALTTSILIRIVEGGVKDGK